MRALLFVVLACFISTSVAVVNPTGKRHGADDQRKCIDNKHRLRCYSTSNTEIAIGEFIAPTKRDNGDPLPIYEIQHYTVCVHPQDVKVLSDSDPCVLLIDIPPPPVIITVGPGSYCLSVRTVDTNNVFGNFSKPFYCGTYTAD